MISLVICSRTSQLNESLRQNIDKTIGTEYEIILIDNSKNKLSIFEAYNKGVELSKYSFICFMHDDIQYLTDNWGKLALAHFENNQVGAIGISGSPYLSLFPGPWWSSGLISKFIVEFDNQKETLVNISYKKPQNNAVEVVALDGVWLFVRKSVFNKIKFDNSSFKGYHFYDLDLSMQLKKSGFILLSVFDILIKHQSMGNINYSWVKNGFLFTNKWKSMLPISLNPVPIKQLLYFEFKSIKFFLKTLYRLFKKAFN
jgi:GT2 family glycosyltransferase